MLSIKKRRTQTWNALSIYDRECERHKTKVLVESFVSLLSAHDDISFQIKLQWKAFQASVRILQDIKEGKIARNYFQKSSHFLRNPKKSQKSKEIPEIRRNPRNEKSREIREHWLWERFTPRIRRTPPRHIKEYSNPKEGGIQIRGSSLCILRLQFIFMDSFWSLSNHQDTD